MNSEGGGIRSERGAIRVREGDGSWWAGPSSPFVVVRAGVASSLLAVLVVRCSFLSAVRSFCVVGVWHRSFGEAVDGGRVALAWRVAMEEGGYLLIH